MTASLKYILMSLTLLLLLTACGGGDSFRITGEMKGLPTQNLNVVYVGDGSVHSTRTALVDGKFMFEGSSKDWTTVYFFNSAHQLMAMVIVKNGDNVEVHLQGDNPFDVEMKGNSASEKLAQWLKANGSVIKTGNATVINNAVKTFVEKNRDNLAATVVLTNYYRSEVNPSQADSLYILIDSKVKGGNFNDGWTDQIASAIEKSMQVLPDTLRLIDHTDTLRNIPTRQGLLLLYSPDERDRNTVSDKFLKATLSDTLLVDSLRLRLVEIDRGVRDTAQWKRSVRNDSLPWMRVWHPFNVDAIDLNAGETMMVIDSTGTVIYKGHVTEEALKL